MLLLQRGGVTPSVRWFDPAVKYLLPRGEGGPIPPTVEQVARSFTLPERLADFVFLAVPENDPGGEKILLILSFEGSSQILGQWSTPDAGQMGGITLREAVVACLGARVQEILREPPFTLEDLPRFATQLRQHKLAHEIIMYLF